MSSLTRRLQPVLDESEHSLRRLIEGCKLLAVFAILALLAAIVVSMSRR